MPDPGSCNQESCPDTAEARVFWPGRGPVLMCKPHEQKALRIADAMGFHLHTEPVVGGSKEETHA